MIKLNQSGQILIPVFIALGVVLFTVLFIISGAQIYFQNASYSVDSEKATSLAEAGIDKALNSLNKTGGSYSGEAETSLGDGSYSIIITSKDASTKVIEVIGYVPDKNNPRAKRTVRIEASKGVGVAFVYGIQVGEGGLELGNGNTIKGTIYSNGSIIMGNNNTVTGDAWVAAGVPPTADQQTDCQTCVDFSFGKQIDGQNRLDVGMSFKPSVTDKIRKVSLKIKKIGNPPDVTVRIMADDSGQPKKNDVYATGILSSNLVTTEYGWIDVTFSTNPTLSAGTIYWMMIDTSSDSSNYWSWQNDLAQSYNNGEPKWSSNWSAGNPEWNLLSGDLSFKVYMGGITNSLLSGNGTKVLGNVHVNTIDRLIIEKDAYYQSITNSTVSGSSCPNSHCYPGSEDPSPQVFPISEANITGWKGEAAVAGAISQPVCGSQTAWGPGKYTGNLTLQNECNIKVKTPIWVTGDISMGNQNRFTLDSSYGTGSGIIVIDGKAVMGNQNKFLGTGLGNSILVLLTTYDSRTNNNSAVTIGNVGNTGVFYADKGIIDPGNNNQFKEITAWKIKLTNESIIDYETGLASILFSSGPSGTYSLVKGTYQVK
ncbi:MAG: choice-of-anchor R domain-containing protein [Candidatus Daviesbacteria bacterium]|nr:choice-of-anchor R domain-containing protein [Candidatus Daviesbacteria bacterium]